MGLFGWLTGSLGEFEIKIEELVLESNYYLGIYCKGSIPIKTSRNVTLVTSIIDVTNSDTLSQIIYLGPNYQEDGNKYFRALTELGLASPGLGWEEWTPLNLVAQDYIFPPFRGSRKLAIHTRIIDVDNVNTLNLTKFDKNYLNGRSTKYFDFQFYGKHGYIEFDKVVENLELLTVKIAMCIAMADGSLDRSEGNKIKDWIKSKLETIDPSVAQISKKKFNFTLKNMNQELSSGLNLEEYKNYLHEFEEEASRFDKTDLFTLILNVMSSDGQAHKRELELIDIAQEIIDYDYTSLKNIKDKAVINLDLLDGQNNNLEEIIGIDENMSLDEINEKLAVEFNKWNSRRESLSDPKEIENASNMLAQIATIRGKYN